MAPLREAWAGRSTRGFLLPEADAESDAEGSVDVEAVIKQVQAHVFQRRVRVRDFFLDQDRARRGSCTRQQFARALSNICPSLRPRDVGALAEHFSEAPRPQLVGYPRFCQVLDDVFGPSSLEKRPDLKVPKPGAMLECTAGFRPARADDEARAREVLRRVALLTRVRGVHLDECYAGCQRTDLACQVSMRGSGKITRSMFLQRFPYMRDFSERDLQLLLQRYAAENGTVQLRPFLREVAALAEAGDAPVEVPAAPAAEGEEEAEDDGEEAAAAACRPEEAGGEAAAPRPEEAGAGVGAAPLPHRPSSAQSLRRTVSASRLSTEGDAAQAPRQGAFGRQRPASAQGLRGSAYWRSAAFPQAAREDRATPARPQSAAASASSACSSRDRAPLPRPESAAASASSACSSRDPRPGAEREEPAPASAEAPAAEGPQGPSPQPPLAQEPRRRPTSAAPVASRPSSAASRGSGGSGGSGGAAGWPASTLAAGRPSGASSLTPTPAASLARSRPASAPPGSRPEGGQRRGPPRAEAVAAASAAPRPDLLARLRGLVAERRLRVSECFQDYDRLRKGLCTFTQLRTALTVAGLALEPKEYETLFNLFQRGDGWFRYKDFCADVGGGGGAEDAATSGIPSPPTTSRCKAELEPRAQGSLEELEAQLRRRVQVRRLEMRSTFDSFCRGRVGHVTKAQFARLMAMLGFRLSEDQLGVLCRAYCDTHDGQELNYLHFCAALEQPGRSRPDGAAGAAPEAPPASSGKPRGGGSRYFDHRGRVVPLAAKGARPAGRP